MNTLFCKAGKHASHVAKHLRTHGHKYAGGMFAGFAVVKAFVLLAGLIGSFSLFQHYASADFVDPTSACAGVTEIPQSECTALLNLYNSTNGDNRTDHTNRGDTGAICSSRYGITCSAGYVNQIILPSNNLSGSADVSGLPNLYSLNLNNNQLSSITLSGLDALNYLGLNVNQISSIDLTGLVNMSQIDLQQNQLTSIDLAGMPNLHYIHVDNNQLSSLDISNSTGLVMLSAGGNQLSSIDLSNLTNLTFLGLADNQLTSIDLSDLNNLINLYLQQDQLTSIDLSHLDSLSTLGLGGHQLTSVDLSHLTGLTQLRINDAQLTNIDLSHLTNLTYLGLNDNHLISIDLSGLTNLTSLNLQGTQLSSIDLSHLTNLTSLYLTNDDQLSSIDLSHLTNLTSLYLTNDNHLISIDLSNLTNLTQLVLNNNQLSSIDLSHLTNLTSLDLQGTQLSSIDLSHLTNLTSLYLTNDNHLISIDLSGLTNLTQLELEKNQLSSIDLSNLTNLTFLGLADNQLTSIDLSHLTGLSQLDLENNLLTTLPESTLELVNLGLYGGQQGFLDGNCWDVGSMSSDLISFLNGKAGTDAWQTSNNPDCPGSADIAGVGLSISSKLLDPVIADGSILRYRVDYHNNGATDSDHTQISILVPSELQLLSSNIPYTSEETGVDAVTYGTTGDVCYTQFLDETGLYMDAMNQRAQGLGAPDAYTLILNFPTLSIRNIFLGAPFNGQFSMLGDFFDALLNVQGGSFSNFLENNLGIDPSELVGCGVGQRTKYTRDLGTLPAGSGGKIIIVTQAQNPTSDTLSLDTILPIHIADGTPSPSVLQLPNDINTKNHSIAISYTNASDQGVLFRPNNPAYPMTNSNASILSGIIHPGMTDQQKVIALWQFVKDTTFNYPSSDNDGHQWYIDNIRNVSDYHNPVYLLNGLYGMCGEINGTLARLANLAGFSSRIRGLSGHVVQEVYVDSGRALLDADGGVYRTGEDGHIYSLEELADNPDIMRNNPQDNNYLIEEYINMVSTTGDNYPMQLPDLTPEEANKNIFIFLHPNDTIKYGYSLIGIMGNNGEVDDGDGSITHNLSPDQYTNVYGEDFGVTEPTETGFIYADEIPYLVTTMDISLASPTDKTIYTSISTDGGVHRRAIGVLDQRIGYTLNPGNRTDDVHKYRLKFNCTDCTQDDIANIIPQISIKDNFIFNTKILPYTGQLDIYTETLDNASGGIAVNYNTNTDTTLHFMTAITGDANESDTLNNTQVVDMSPWTHYDAALLPNDKLKTYAGQVFLWKGYTHNATSLFSDLPEDTLVGTSAISFLNTDTIRQNILIRGDNVEALLPADTIVTQTGVACYDKILLAPQDVSDQFEGATKTFKLGSPCDGTSLDFSNDIRIRVHVDQTLGDTVSAQTSSDDSTREDIPATKIDAHTIEIDTDHFSFFKITSDTPSDTGGEINTGGATDGAGAGGSALIKDQCPAQRDCTSSYYDQLCGPCPATSTGAVHGSANASGDTTNSPYSAELTEAYQRAFTKGITTMPTIQQANLNSKIIREQMAKMITEFAIKVLNKKPNTTLACSFTDTKNETSEMSFYIKTACQLGLMGRASDGKTTNPSFNPKTTITRAQFATVLSRLLYGNKYNSSDSSTWADKHLQALNKAGIITNISTPSMNEIRGYVMLMLMRSSMK